MAVDAFENTARSFLLGLSVGMLLTTMLKFRGNSRRTQPSRDNVEIAPQDSFTASDAPAY